MARSDLWITGTRCTAPAHRRFRVLRVSRNENDYFCPSVIRFEKKWESTTIVTYCMTLTIRNERMGTLLRSGYTGRDIYLISISQYMRAFKISFSVIRKETKFYIDLYEFYFDISIYYLMILRNDKMETLCHTCWLPISIPWNQIEVIRQFNGSKKNIIYVDVIQIHFQVTENDIVQI